MMAAALRAAYPTEEARWTVRSAKTRSKALNPNPPGTVLSSLVPMIMAAAPLARVITNLSVA